MQQNVSTVRYEDGGQHSQEGAFPRSIGTHYAEYLFFPYFEIQVINGVHPVEAFAERLSPYHFSSSTCTTASAGIPGFSFISGLSTVSFTAYTSFTRSSFVWMVLGVNSALFEIDATLALKGVPGKLSTYTSAFWPCFTRPSLVSRTYILIHGFSRLAIVITGVPGKAISPT